MFKKSFSFLLAITLLLTMPFALAQEETQVFIDSVGREVTLPKHIERIVPSGSLSQMVLYALAPQFFVGLTNAWDDDEMAYIETKDLPIIGQIYGKGDINLEVLAATDTQVIIDIGEPKKTVKEDMDGLFEQTGIPAVHITANLDNMGEAIRTLGTLLNLEERANALADYCDKTYENSLALLEKVKEEDKVSVLYIMGDEGLRVIPQNSFNSQTLDMYGNNVAVVENAKGNSAEVDMEQIYLFEPEVILFDSLELYNKVSEDPLWKDLSAVKEGKYVLVPSAPYNWIGFPPSVQRYLGMLWMGKIFYPQLAEYNLFEEVSTYYQLFYQKPLTEEAFDSLTQNSFIK